MNTRPEVLVNALPFLCAAVAVMLAGAGINTQSAFRGTKGLHGSMYFTLALPVSRFRLLAVRAGIGLIEAMAVIVLICGGLWVVVPVLREQLTFTAALGYGFAIAISSSVFYSLSVLLATVLDGQWQIWGSMIGIGLFQFISVRLPLPPAFNWFLAASSLVTHVFPWPQMGSSVVTAAILLFVSMKIVQWREY
ncbi:MAG TPA: hypothetical protein VGK48_26940 [Terriglobia bacterium]